ncbi:MAG: hypothetical protein JXJ20_00535 [Anaerolineae bacterium]|nr:hypothetical protein [Anaerolineae bacterium]
MKHKRLLFVGAVIVSVLLLPSAVGVQAQGGPPVTAIQYGTAVTGTLSTQQPALGYSFNTSPGDLVSVNMLVTSGDLAPLIEVVDAYEQPIILSVGNRSPLNEGHIHLSGFAHAGGTYRLHVGSENGTYGDFVLRVDGRPRVPREPLAYDAPVMVEVPVSGEPQYFEFEVHDCPTRFIVTNMDEGDPITYPFLVYLRHEGGMEVAELRGGLALGDSVTLAPESGWYEVEVLSDLPDRPGSVQLLITCGFGEEPGECPPCEPEPCECPEPGECPPCEPEPCECPEPGECPPCECPEPGECPPCEPEPCPEPGECPPCEPCPEPGECPPCEPCPWQEPCPPCECPPCEQEPCPPCECPPCVCPPCPGPGPEPGPECGNGICEPGEDLNNCDVDCAPA